MKKKTGKEWGMKEVGKNLLLMFFICGGLLLAIGCGGEGEKNKKTTSSAKQPAPQKKTNSTTVAQRFAEKNPEFISMMQKHTELSNKLHSLKDKIDQCETDIRSLEMKQTDNTFTAKEAKEQLKISHKIIQKNIKVLELSTQVIVVGGELEILAIKIKHYKVKSK